MNHNTLALTMKKRIYFSIILVVFLSQNPQLKNYPTLVKEII